MKKIFLDTETTGLSPGMIAQLAMIIIDENNEIRAKNYFFTIDYITSKAQSVCNDRGVEFYAKASNGKRFKDYANEILEEIKDATLVAHNLPFDENFISTEFWRLGITFRPSAGIDTKKYFKDKVQALNMFGRVKEPNMGDIINHYELSEEEIIKTASKLFRDDIKFDLTQHDAIYDTTALYMAFTKAE